MVDPKHSLIIHNLACRLLNGTGTYRWTKNIRNIKLDENYVLMGAKVETKVFGQELKN